MLDEPFAGIDPTLPWGYSRNCGEVKVQKYWYFNNGSQRSKKQLSITDRAYLLFEGKILKRMALLKVSRR
ncbi:MAG: hypothetical protein R2728_07680 [Chitinophagales bacterium]